MLKSCFNDTKEAELAEIEIFIPPKKYNKMKVKCAVVENLAHPLILPLAMYNELLGNKDASQMPNLSHPIQNTLGSENYQLIAESSPKQTLKFSHITESSEQTCEDRTRSTQVINSNIISTLDEEAILGAKQNNPLSDPQQKKESPAVCGGSKNSRLSCKENNSEVGQMVNAFFEVGTYNLDIMPLEVDLAHMQSKEIKHKLSELVSHYKPIKTKTTDVKLKIILNDERPVVSKRRRFSLSEKEIIDKQIQNWLEEGIIEECSSDFNSSLVLVKKKDNSFRICVDYREINKRLIRDCYPILSTDEVLDQLQDNKVFSKLDLRNAFFHVEIEESSRKYTAFSNEFSQYQFQKVPFGLSSSPQYFLKFINRVFKDLLKENVLILYFDDILVCSQTEEENLRKLERVFQTASEYGLDINFKKCAFMQREISFLGHIVGNGTIRPSKEKTLAIKNFPEPRNTTQLQSFLGLTGYFRKFICSYAQIAKPLSDLLRGVTPFVFGDAQRAAFKKLKELMTDSPVLHMYRQGSQLELHTDASSHGFGAILFQLGFDDKFHPIHFMSKKTTKAQEKFCSYELEILAIVEALKKFRHYLLGTRFKIFTDCEAFTKTLAKKEMVPKVARWALILQEYDYEIVHRPGTQLKHVDALSRYPVMCLTVAENAQGITPKIISAQENDEFIKTIKQLNEEGLSESDYLVKNGVLYKVVEDQELLVVPENMQIEVCKKAHQLGHFAATKTENLVKRDYYFPQIRKRVEEVVRNCVKCILVERKKGKHEGFLHTIPKGDIPLSVYHSDFLGPLPSTNKQYNHIFSVVDAFSKFVWLYPVKTTSAREAIQKLKVQQSVFGNPERLISDRGTAFMSNEFKEYCENENIEHLAITTGIPRGNGQAEIVNKILIPVLAKLSLDEPTKWYKHVATVQRTLNASVTRSTKKSPFELLVGVKMRSKEDQAILELLEEERISARLDYLQKIRQEACENIARIQAENRKQFNKKRKPAHVYKTGDLVAIRRTQFGTGLKLRVKFFGPYKITKVKANDRYEVMRVGNNEGPRITSSAADSMKPWAS